MAILTKAQLQSANSASFPDNNSQAITPQILRTYNSDVIDTLVDSLDTGSFAFQGVTNEFTQPNNFTSISASSFVSASEFVGNGSKITGITASISLPILDEGIPQGNATSMNFTGSAISATIVGGTAVVQVNIEGAGFVTTSSFNSFTSSTNTFTQSANTSITNLNASTASQQVSIDALNQFTASQSTASIVNSINSLNTFTQSQETFNTNITAEVTALEVATASLFTSVSNLNQSSASQQISIDALNTNSASVNTSISALNQSSASQQISIDALNVFTASQSTASIVTSITELNTFSASALVSISNLNTTTASLNTSASLALVTASFDNGTRNLTFTKGDSSTFNVNIPDVSGSAGDFVTTASFNSYTQSNDQRVSSLETNSGSVNTSITNINSTTASLNTSVSALNQFTASQSTASLVTSIDNLNGFSASALVSISNLNSATESLNTSVTNLNSATASLFGSASLGLTTASVNVNIITFSKGDGTTFDVAVAASGSVAPGTISGSAQITALGFVSSSVTASSLITASAVGNTITFTKGDASTFDVSVTSTPIDTGSFVTTSSFNAYTQSNDQRVSSLESNSASVNISVAALNTFSASAQISINNLNLSSGSQQVSIDALNTFTASQSTASIVNSITELNSFSASALISINNINQTTASLNTSVSNLNQFTASATESVVTAIVTNNGSNYYIIDGVNQPKLSFVPGPTYRFDLSGIGGSHPFKFSTSPNGPTQYTTGVTSGSNFIQIEVGYNTTTPLYYYCTNHSGMGNEINVLAIDELVTTASFNSYTQSTDSRLTNIESTTASLNTSVSNLNTATASLFTSASLTLTTASVTLNTITFTKGDGTTFPLTVNTGSAGAAFPYTGTASISGSLEVTGSAIGNVLSASITSNTASIDFSLANYFELTSSVTPLHLNITNIKPGTTATLIISASASSSILFSPNVAQPSGSAYSGSLGSIDVLSLVAFNTSKVNVVSTKALV